MKETTKVLIPAVVAITLALASPLAAAVDVGLGVDVNTNGGGENNGGYGVSLPLRFGNFTVEPELSFNNSKYERTYPASPTNSYTAEYKTLNLETGVYWRQQVIPSVETYIGGRVGYTKYDNTYTYPLNPGAYQRDSNSGFYLGPTVGAEYFFNKNFSLGLDVSLLYESTSGESISGGNVVSSDNTNLSYQSRARLRFYY